MTPVTDFAWLRQTSSQIWKERALRAEVKLIEISLLQRYDAAQRKDRGGEYFDADDVLEIIERYP